MTESFRLKSATYAGRDGELVAVNIVGAAPGGNWTTAITGRNGSGKSRLLAQIAIVFDALDSTKTRSRTEASVSYSIGSSNCTVSVSKGRVETILDGRPVDPTRLPRPRTVAAVTTTAFDKFPISQTMVSKSSAPRATPLYRYLGLKDSRGRISAVAGVHRALDELFSAVRLDEVRRSRIADVFIDLGYEPRIEVIYRWTNRGSTFVAAGADGGQKGYESFLRSSIADDQTWARLDRATIEDSDKWRELSNSAQFLQDRAHNRNLVLVADFESQDFAHVEHLRAAQQLKRSGMLEMKSVILIRADSGDRIDLGEASSGELSLVTSFLGIASAIDDQSLVLIDEPEINLHPEWQSGFMNRISHAFDGFRGIHFVVATHSPLVVSGVGETFSNVLSMEPSPGGKKFRNLSGKSADEVLIGAFNVAGKNNLYLKQSLVRALRMASDQKYDSLEFVGLMEILEQAIHASDVNSAVREVVHDLARTVQRAQIGLQ